MIALSSSDLQRNRVILRQELADDLPPVTGDRVQLQQVILNLLLNAADAMSDIDDRPRAVGRSATERDEGDRCPCDSARCGRRVSNLENMDKLFEPFYTTKSGGMGIGLSVSRSIIESHQGRLWADRTMAREPLFHFRFPRDPERVAVHGTRR